MSEDDRQVKAARAKALLKKRQQKSAGKPGLSSPSPPPSRAFTPLPSDLPASSSPLTHPESLVNVFGGAAEAEGGSWLNSLARVETPPPPVPAVQTPEITSSSPPSVVTSPTFNLVHSLKVENQRQQNVISTLESEKRSLLGELDRQKGLESNLQEAVASLNQEHLKSKSLSDVIQQLKEQAEITTGQNREQQKTTLALQAEKQRLLESLNTAEEGRQNTEGRLREESSRNLHLSSKVRELEASVREGSDKISQHQQTISLLVSEKTSLTSALERLEQLEPRAQELEALLEKERIRSTNLELNVNQLEASLKESDERVSAYASQEKELQDRARELERELQLTNGSLNDLQAESDRYQRKAQELEERIQNDDRVEKLEGVLQNTQDRAEELEFQLSKTKQAHATLKSVQDELQSQLEQRIEAASAVEAKYAELEASVSITRNQLSSVVSERDALLQEKAAAALKADQDQKTLTDLQEKLSQAATEFTAHSKQLQTAQNEVKKALRRAEEAEKIQGDLQTEGVTLMRSLEEMRPKIVELTNIRLELVDKIESLETIIRKKEDVISHLESDLEETREKELNAEKHRQRENAMRKKDEFSSQDNLSQMQKAYDELHAELEALRVNLRDREQEREGYHQLALRRLEEIDRITFSSQAQNERLASAEKELEERRLAQSEDHGFVEGMQNEIETLRNELAFREEELESLRQPTSELAQSLDGEMVSAIKQQQIFELSNARSQIRALESAVFESDARAHTLQKQVSSLMDQLTQLRSISHTPTRPFSPTPGLPSRPSSRAKNLSSDDLRRSSFSTTKPPANRPARKTFESLSPETRHKRRVSLGMLKARIDSEVASSVKSHPLSRALTPLPEGTGMITSSVMEASEPHHIRGFRRHQFLDESHIFWCNSCHGDLVIL